MLLQTELLETSFEQIKPKSDEFVSSFYHHLFTAHPEAQPLFAQTDMNKQRKMLFQGLEFIVENSRNPAALKTMLQGLGARHVKYGALPEHYPLVGEALLSTLEEYLGEQWTPTVQQAWIDAYGVITEIMLEGAEY